MSEQKVDRLVVLVVSGLQAGSLMKDLLQEKLYFTVINSTGGLMNEAVVCLMLGLAEQRLPALLALVRQHCRPYRQFIPAQMRPPGEFMSLPMVEAQLGGAMVYMMTVERFEQF